MRAVNFYISVLPISDMMCLSNVQYKSVHNEKYIVQMVYDCSKGQGNMRLLLRYKRKIY